MKKIESGVKIDNKENRIITFNQSDMNKIIIMRIGKRSSLKTFKLKFSLIVRQCFISTN